MTQLFGPAGESLYSLMTSRMRVPAELPFDVAAETYSDLREATDTPVRRAA
jgi:hypothetical protein